MSSGVTISGAASGLDTAGIINQLVAVQTNQQTMLKAQQSTVQKRADAFSALVTSLNALGTQATDLAKTSAWTGATATSSSTGVTAKATASLAGTITFDVTKVAHAHTLISGATVSSTNDVVASEGLLVVRKADGNEAEISVGNGTLGEVVAALNSSGMGLTATAVRTSSSAYRLQISATSTGANSSFTVEGFDGFDVPDGDDQLNVLTTGSDAKIKVGKEAATAYEVTSTTNTFASLVPGLSFTVSKEETGVTVSSTIDGSSVADKIGKLVDAANAILSDIASKTAYSTTTRTGGAFVGESSVRALQQNILGAVSSAGAPGVQLTRGGRLSFDRTAFLTAFSADPAKVARGFGAAGVFTPVDETVTGTTMTVTGATKTTRPGTYDIQVDSMAEREQWVFGGGFDMEGSTFVLSRGDTTLTYFGDVGATPEDAVASLNAQSEAAGFGVTASIDPDGNVFFTADSVGSSAAFTVTLDDMEGEQVSAGTDISGMIDGQAATGVGSVLSLPTGTGGAVGLSIDISTTSDDFGMTGGALGTLTYTPGLAQRLITLIGDATATSTGSLTTATDGANTEVKRYQASIDAWDDRLTSYRQSLTRQFTAMETALAKLKSSTSALSGLIKSTSSNSSSDS